VRTSIERLPALVGVLPAIGVFFAPLVTIRPNRVAEGVAVRAWEQLPGVGAGAPGGWLTTGISVVALVTILAVGGLVVVSAVRRSRVSASVMLVWSVAITVLPWLLVAGTVRAFVDAGETTELTRFSPAGGLWLAQLAAVASWHAQMHGGAHSRRFAVAALLLSASFVAVLFSTQPFDLLSYRLEFAVRAERFWQEARTHVVLSASSVLAACGIGIPAGMIAYRHPRVRDAILGVISTVQTIPSLAMFGLLIAPLAALSRAVPALRAAGVSGVGATPALIALTLYALLPIVRNTLTGLSTVPPDVRESGVAMGMSRRQQFWMVEVPIALPLVVRGVRTAAVQAVGNTTVAGLIGAGGLGWFIFQGLGQAAIDLVVLGVIPIVLLAVITDRLFERVRRAVAWGASS
jgi:osmoprotectant transport system permease protein